MGGGMGGLNLAALLTNEGKRVLVLERAGRDRLGGRAASGKICNAAIDNGIKGLILAGSQDEVYRRIGKKMPENVCRWTDSGVATWRRSRSRRWRAPRWSRATRSSAWTA